MRSFLPASLILVVASACPQSGPPGPEVGPSGCEPELGNCVSPEALISMQIDEVRNSLSPEIDLAIDGATVTYVIPPDPSHPDVHGFFIQAEKKGPALFVRVDPAELSPSPVAGDRVRMQVRRVRRDPATRIEATEISNYERVSQDGDVAALIQDLTGEDRLLDTGWQFDGELVRLEGSLIHEWTAPGSYIPLEQGLWFAAIDAKGGYSNSRYIVVAPPKVADPMGDAAFCEFKLEAVPFRTGSKSVEVWAFDPTDFVSLKCPEVELDQTLALGPNQVRLTFSRPLDPATVPASGAGFTFTGGIKATAAKVQGSVVVVTTDAQQPRTEYAVQFGVSVKDLMGNGITANEGREKFLGYFPRAKLVLNEILCNGPAGRDLIELRAIEAGSTSHLTVTWDGASKPSLLATFPDTQVEADDLIVVHLNTNPLKGDAIYSELLTKDEQGAEQSIQTNYPAAWDFVYEDAECDGAEGVLRVRDIAGKTMDGVPLWNSAVNPGTLDPLYASVWLRSLQAEYAWDPTTCGGQYCSPTTTPSLADITVDHRGVRQLENGGYITVGRKPGPDTDSRSDWAGAGPGTFGLPNP